MESPKIRKPAVAGTFYPLSAKAIESQIKSFIKAQAGKKEAIACMLPHAGYMYSGRVAAETLCGIKIKKNIILLGPNHTGYGAPFSIMSEGIWQTPLGEIKINSELAKTLLKNSQYLKDDALAHTYEHSLEVELPILQYFKTDFEIVPIIFMSDDIGSLKKIGEEIAKAIKDTGSPDSVLIIASSDMTHYEPQAQAEEKDKQAIEAILSLDEDKLIAKIGQLSISMCGYAPVTVMIKIAKILGAKSAELIKYQTSGDVTGDKDSVVGYAGITVY
ncbi:MAG: AmmeMemoRadiSam system protein B [Candidatus Omnitrophica bacterium]|nr:AmmeMemoRadiSam system protein B [Candidatus Omnitrophota bacterium]MDD5237603.1 AmmeMemoRadiSam system protein B [Candidatus Omnitrophota bacterium]